MDRSDSTVPGLEQSVLAPSAEYDMYEESTDQLLASRHTISASPIDHNSHSSIGPQGSPLSSTFTAEPILESSEDALYYVASWEAANTYDNAGQSRISPVPMQQGGWLFNESQPSIEDNMLDEFDQPEYGQNNDSSNNHFPIDLDHILPAAISVHEGPWSTYTPRDPTEPWDLPGYDPTAPIASVQSATTHSYGQSSRSDMHSPFTPMTSDPDRNPMTDSITTLRPGEPGHIFDESVMDTTEDVALGYGHHTERSDSQIENPYNIDRYVNAPNSNFDPEERYDQNRRNCSR